MTAVGSGDCGGGGGGGGCGGGRGQTDDSFVVWGGSDAGPVAEAHD